MAIEKPGARQSLQSYINGHRTQKRQDHGYEKNKGSSKNVEMCRPRVGEANPLFSLCITH